MGLKIRASCSRMILIKKLVSIIEKLEATIDVGDALGFNISSCEEPLLDNFARNGDYVVN